MATLTEKDLVDGLKEIGLETGDLVLLHSSLASLGFVEGGPETVVNAFLKVLGDAGTLVVPTFGDLGILTRVVSEHPRAVNSVHPKASVAAIGAHAKELCADHWKAEMAHAEDTPYVRLANLGGYVLLLGVDQDRSTMLHTAEELLRLPYMKTTKPATFETPEGEVTKSWTFFPGPHRDFIGIDHVLRESGKMEIGRIGESALRLIKGRDLLDIVVAYGKKHPDWALCDNPNCADCIKQRADLRRARFREESFTLAASSKLAGRYVPEMIENLRAAGIDAVELDIVQGKPAFLSNAKRLTAIREEFERAGIQVAGLRVTASTERDEPILNAAREAGIQRVLMPITAESASRARAASERELTVSFYNQSVSSKLLSQWILAMKEEGLTPHFTFNAAAFARIGEKPFLKSYKEKLRRYVDQLDIEDATFAGEDVTLANGNAEIKEMISILRVAHFNGRMVLRANHPASESLLETTDRFLALLEAM